MKIPSGVLLAIAVFCGIGVLWIFQSRPAAEWPILLLLVILGGWLAPTPKK